MTVPAVLLRPAAVLTAPATSPVPVPPAAMLPAGAFFERLRRVAGARGSSLALAIVDIARFDSINEALGFAAGDRLLEAVGDRLAARLRTQALVTRIGGDVFALLLADIADPAGAVAAAREVLGSFDEPFELDGGPRAVSAHLGVALCPAHGRDVSGLLHAARVALASAKEAGRDLFIAPPGAQEAPVRRASRSLAGGPLAMRAGREVRDGLARGEFGVHFQPIHDLGAGRVDTLEALVRWRHPTRGLLAPEAFLPLAEQAGLAHALCVRVLDSACDSLRRWRAHGHDELRVAVNLSAQEIGRDDFAATVAATLDRHGLPPASLELELTEHEQLDDGRAMVQMTELARQGVALTIDDFGVKYSSLRYLHRLPVRTLKVDRSFVRDIGQCKVSTSIVAAVVGIARQMGLRLVAEGVERVRQMDELRHLDCHIMQGFLFSPAVPAHDVPGYLDRAAPAT